MKRAIIIMAKVPISGNVKTRLQSVISPEKSAELATAFLKDTVNKAKSICENTIIAFFPPSEKDKLAEILHDEKKIIGQTGENLGERMFSAFEFAFANDSDAIVMLGTDSPTFPADFIEQAFEFLETNSDAVLGKTDDGGFYLIGLRVLPKEIFENVAWSSPKTFEEVYRNIMDLNLHLRETPSWYDVDEPPDFEKLKAEFQHNANAKRRAPQTFEWIEKEA
jgi:rSAM/selenodomain-associated transferase 1